MNSTQITFASSLTDLCEVNSSFDSGVLRIAYPGKNRNKTFISKETFERCIPTMYNCPVACNYDRETDTLGGHDVEIAHNADGTLKLCNMTTPVGCIPESARHWWATVTEEDGTEREYLHTDVLLWRRQEAYEKIKRNGITSHSMEINVKSGKMVDGYYVIDDFEFTAFVLIGVEPCFESSAIEVFSMQNFKAQLEEMMKELKDVYGMIGTSEEDNNKIQFNNDTEGGNGLDETINNTEVAEAAVQEDVTDSTGEFALTGNIIEELHREVERIEMICCDWGEYPRYSYADSDFDAGEVYVWDRVDWMLYGFKYTANGDSVEIDLESKARKKYVIADFDEGEQEAPFPQVFDLMQKWISENAGWEAKYTEANSALEEANKELDELRTYKQNVELEHAKAEIKSVFDKFGDLENVEEFRLLKEKLEEGTTEIGADELTEKCYALRGRYSVVFSANEQKEPKIIVDKNEAEDSPYGGLVEKYSK